jgi:fumarylacetoacetate (FAA) hydrolase
MPASFWTDPLIYQGGSDTFLGPCEDIAMADLSWGIDFEAEVAVIVDDVPMGVSAENARHHIQLVMLVNDVSLRNLIPGELAKGFGFYNAKPSSAFSPVAVTPEALGNAWDGAKLHLPLRAVLNGNLIGQPNAGVDMTFDFGQLIAHAAKTRPLCAGTIIGSGTVSNLDRSNGSCCLAEVRMLEIIAHGSASTDFMQFGDRIQIDMHDHSGQSIFGEINQQVIPYVG